MFGRFRRRAADGVLALEAALVLVAVRYGLRTLDYPALCRRSDLWASRLRSRRIAVDPLLRIPLALDLARRKVFGHVSCLEEALVIQWMLHRRQIEAQIQIGVAKRNGEQLIGHAWVESNGQVVSIDRISPLRYRPMEAAWHEQPDEHD